MKKPGKKVTVYLCQVSLFLMLFLCASPFKRLITGSVASIHNDRFIFKTDLFPRVNSSMSHYPKYRSLLSLLMQWSPNDPTPPKGFSESLQHFNFSDPSERALAQRYRDAELPFKVYDVPMFNHVSRKWTKQYLSLNFRSTRYHVEESPTNRFMYWTTARKRTDELYKPPTKVVSDNYDFDSWSKQAEIADVSQLPSSSPHLYFMAGSQRSDNESNFIYRDLHLFRADTPNLFIPAPEHNKGTQCRFGMRGVIAESHFDSGRNAIAVIRGSKRYILTPPESCKHLAIISNKKHPSFRHSQVDFTNLIQAEAHKFQDVQSVETIVRAGEVLYLPSFWFHYIVSLDYSVQCNARSGMSPFASSNKVIDKCMRMRIPT